MSTRKITALIHARNDAATIAQALDSLRAADEILLIDHGSSDDTVKIARDHGAVVKEGVPGVNPGVYAIDAHHDWILCLLPSETASEALEASLQQWKDGAPGGSGSQNPEPAGFSFQLRERTANGWQELGTHTRLVNRKRINWEGELPADDPGAPMLPGHLLRFCRP